MQYACLLMPLHEPLACIGRIPQRDDAQTFTHRFRGQAISRALETVSTRATSTLAALAKLARAGRELRPHATEAAKLLKTLGNEQRLMILCTLVSGPLSVIQLNQRLPLSQMVLSQHLNILRDCGIVAATRESQNISYSLIPGIATRIIDLLHEEFCSH